MPTQSATLLQDAHVSEALPEPAPFVKWVGGKGKLRHVLSGLMPAGVELMRHVEPFVGGGALFFARRPERALLCDVNADLIATYEAVRDDVQGVIRALHRLAPKHGKEHYYEVRERYNARRGRSRSERAAMFIYLNKTCFNGLHRVNRKGHFNVPMGRYKNPRIVDPLGLYSASRALQQATLRCAPFQDLLRTARPGDFVYLDPPYEPLTRTANFTSYSADGFSQDDQRELRDVVRELDRRGAHVMLSNSDVPFVRELYRGFEIKSITAPRAVSCVGSKRAPVSELVIRNYR